jgi:hypothetical protein
MNLANAATYFSSTPVSGWNGTAWVDNISTVTFLAYDKSLSANKRRFILVDPADTVLGLYPVIKVPNGEMYAVGRSDSDIEISEYGRSVLLHRVFDQIAVRGTTPTVKASGMPGSAVRSTLGLYWGDIERGGYSASKEFDNINFTQNIITFPRDCPVGSEHELSVNGQFFAVSEYWHEAGFVQCRAMRKRST